MSEQHEHTTPAVASVDPDVYWRFETHEGGRFLCMGIDETDDAIGISMALGPLPDDFNEAEVPPLSDEIRQNIIEGWRAINADPDREIAALAARTVAIGGTVSIETDTATMRMQRRDAADLGADDE